jgi:hypothetical protein
VVIRVVLEEIIYISMDLKKSKELTLIYTDGSQKVERTDE